MKENMLDVLFYLFENYSDVESSTTQDKEVLQNYLKRAGFESHEITKAFDWLEKLSDDTEISPDANNSTALRIFSPEEQFWINPECQGYLLFLEQAKILDVQTREQVIEQIMALEDADFDLDKLKWVLLMVMINRTDVDTDFLWIDSVTSADEVDEYYH